MIEVQIARQNNLAAITERGELAVGPRKASTFYTATASVNNTAVNVVAPKSGMIFIITTIVLSGDRNIGANGAIVDLFENDIGPTDGTVDTQIYQDEIAKQTRAVLTGLYIAVPAGKWVNVKADDVNVRANIAGFYIPNGSLTALADG
jgi:hypothetical protein